VRIVAGAWRGRRLATPAGTATRPTADRVRQALFDMLMHAPWFGPDAMQRARVLDAFAGTGALALEALSRGAAHAVLFERDAAALAILRANVAACGAGGVCTVLRADATAPPPAAAACGLVFLDPPYGGALAGRAAAALTRAGWLATDALVVVETARDEAPPALGIVLAEQRCGAARVTVLRHG
jgi:16S rRNA (guanine966-N2)-methyltransferase